MVITVIELNKDNLKIVESNEYWKNKRKIIWLNRYYYLKENIIIIENGKENSKIILMMN